ncbi:MAG: hypothetical protein LBN27_07775 [Prevotellaceae bacterium]|jgi:hypothetical protein|nr:hypothetical protein [Prevotellaceae bacterium]
MKNYSVNYSFPHPSFLAGMGSVFNVAGNYYNVRHYNTNRNMVADAWNAVGREMRTAMFNTLLNKKY